MISTLVIAFTIGITNVLASEYTNFHPHLSKNLKICDYYEETTNSEFEGNAFSTNEKNYRMEKMVL